MLTIVRTYTRQQKASRKNFARLRQRILRLDLFRVPQPLPSRGRGVLMKLEEKVFRRRGSRGWRYGQYDLLGSLFSELRKRTLPRRLELEAGAHPNVSALVHVAARCVYRKRRPS
jgi:hypothetical protein